MASFSMNGRGAMMMGGWGRGRGLPPTSQRMDNNIFAALSDPEDVEQNGGVIDNAQSYENSFLDMTVGYDGEQNDWDVVRSKQTKRQRVSSSGLSGREADSLPSPMEQDAGEHYDSLSTDDKFSIILSKLAVNEQRVKRLQSSVDSLTSTQNRVKEVEKVVNSHSDRLKLLEYRSLDSEARCRRRNLLFKGIPENKYENCFQEARRFICEKLHIDKDMYLERAHRLGKFDRNKTRPIIVAFRDFCDTEHILNEATCLSGTNLGVSRDYPNEISKARQSIWKQYKSVRENNPRKKVTFGYPASIRVNGVTVVDLFPDWYDVLKGSRISLPQSQSNPSTQTGDQLTVTRETGLTSLRSRSGILINSSVSRVQGERDQSTPGNQCTVTESVQSSRDNVESGNETSDFEPMSQSLLPQGNAKPADVTSATPATGHATVDDEFKTPRGRSTTRRPNTNSSGKPRSQSVKPRDRKTKSTSKTKGGSQDNNPSTKGKSKSTSRSVSRVRDSNDPPDLSSNGPGDDSQQPSGSSDTNTNT